MNRQEHRRWRKCQNAREGYRQLKRLEVKYRCSREDNARCDRIARRIRLSTDAEVKHCW